MTSTLEQILAEPSLVWPAALPGHLSPSALKTYMRCRESFRRKYLTKDSEPSTHYFVWGGAHNAALVDFNFQQKITTGIDAPIDEVQEAFAAAVDRKTDAEGGDGGINWGKEMSRAKVKDAGVELVRAYMTIAAPAVQPTAVEQRFDITVPGVPVPVMGYIDVVTESRLLELKTAASRGVAEGDRFQGRVYQLAMPKPVEFHVATKTKTPAVYTIADGDEYQIPLSKSLSEVSRLMVVNLATDIVATYEQFGPDEMWPGAFAVRSTCGLCGYRKDCGWWKT